MSKVDLGVVVHGLTLENPFILASGPPGTTCCKPLPPRGTSRGTTGKFPNMS